MQDRFVTSAESRRQARARSLKASGMSSRVNFSLVLHERSNERSVEYIVKDAIMFQKSNKEEEWREFVEGTG